MSDVQNKSARLVQRHVIKHLHANKVKTRIISCYTSCHISTVIRWVNRDDILDFPRTGKPLIYCQATRLSLIGFYCQTKPLLVCGRWTVRLASKYLDRHVDVIGTTISKSSIHRILQANNLKPHRSKYFLHISDPDFFRKMNHIIALYFNPPEHLYCFDECPGIQVLQRLAPDLQTEKMKMRLEEFEYIRNGTIDLLAFFSVNTGKAYAEFRSNHTIETLIKVFENHLKIAPKDKPLHYIMDNLNSHCCYELCELISKYSNINCPPEKELNNMAKRREWLMAENKRIVFHYTPFHGSWLNQVEIWFGIFNANCLHESYNSPEVMYNAITQFVGLWNTLLAKPLKWEYNGNGLSEKVIKRVIEILNSAEILDVRFMVKQLKLISNIMRDSWQEIPIGIWNELKAKINEKYESIKVNIINSDSKDKAKISRIENLNRLVSLINHKLKNYYTAA